MSDQPQHMSEVETEGNSSTLDSPAKNEETLLVQSDSDHKPSLWESAASAGQAMAKTAAGGVKALGNTAFQTGKAVVKTAAGVGEATAKQTQRLIEGTTHGVGSAINYVTDNPFLRHVTKALPTNWLLGIISQVDVVKAGSAVETLKEKYPQDSPNQIAHRLMVEKATYAGGMGLATSILPGVAAALLTVDLAATTLLQAEMVYQIAAAYGLDLRDPARKGEVLAIFGLSLGGSRAIKLGLGLLKTAPLAGAMIGAGANAAMLYSLGYAACRFYEAKLNAQPLEESIAATAQLSESYLETAVKQQAVMDQILVHIIVASHPGKSWQDIMPDLQSLNLSPSSLAAIATNIQSPQPLDTLLDQLNRDYAMPLLAQCYRIAQLRDGMTAEEAKVMDTIAAKFEIDREAIESAVKSNSGTPSNLV